MNTPRRLAQATARQGLFLFGWLNFALGTLGLFLPVMPTTVFWIMAAWAWGRSCPGSSSAFTARPTSAPMCRSGWKRGALPGVGAGLRWGAWGWGW